MSTAMNHRKRSCYSYQKRGGAFTAASRQAFYRDTIRERNRGLLGRLASRFHRKSPRPAPDKEPAAQQED